MKRWSIGVLIVLMFVFVLPTFAQDVVTTPEEAADGLAKLLWTIVQVPFAGAVIMFATEVLKRLEMRLLPERYRVHPSLIVVLLTALVWAGYAFARKAGLALQFQDAFAFIETLIVQFGPYILGAIGTAAAVKVAQTRAQAAGVAGFKTKYSQRKMIWS